MAEPPQPTDATLGVLGDLLEDIVVWLDQPLRTGTDNPVSIHRSRGGSAANVASFAAELLPTSFIGRVGADQLGDSLVAHLRAANVDVRAQRGGRTGSIVVLVDEHGERTMLPDRGAAAELAEVPTSWLDGIALLHVPAYAFAVEPSARHTRQLLHTAAARGITLTMDASSTGLLEDLGTRRFLELVAELRPAVLFANASEAELLGLTEATPPPETSYVIKNGAAPTTIVDSSGSRQIPVPPAPIARDTTGAGDAFAAAYLSTLLHGGKPDEAAEAGHHLAAQVLRTPGAGRSRHADHSPSQEDTDL
ncbi:sugar/nucleoside kinase (ribokinase family) [Tamaricihabitans halophyticus]|uniref:Sugar/nucleoside kinase (Ribokinase family) n=1 Tax=Tamaricihabitans halophyticus TaxID=1262583 RepID=A0A4V2ST45_9PSEU|nr:carbohydrate kinase family protein [Tamaricihabitans halophyticus]TCP49356.1 sugar/nucleoside kinase (ribokinase family) [Tamaricihabitans halophyticus]